MQLVVRSIGKYKIIDVGDSARKYEDVVAIQEKLAGLTDNGDIFIAINLAQVEYMHSFFIKTITSYYKKIKAVGGNLSLIGPNEFIRNLINLLNINEYISVFSDEPNFREFLEANPG